MKSYQNNRAQSRPMGARRESNPMTRTYESNGPDVKIRGTARHVADKYLQLARDAHTAGNPVSAENYLQHAEHYFRLIAAAQAGPRAIGEAHPDDSDDENDDRGLPDRFAMPIEPAPQPFAVQTADYPRKVG
jgi:Domain of unknown function (DUF4167)